MSCRRSRSARGRCTCRIRSPGRMSRSTSRRSTVMPATAASRRSPTCPTCSTGSTDAMLDVALVTFTEIPDGDQDDHLLVAALQRRGLSVAFVCWDDPDVRWPAAGMVMIRSTWDYHERLDAFLAWADYVGS